MLFVANDKTSLVWKKIVFWLFCTNDSVQIYAKVDLKLFSALLRSNVTRNMCRHLWHTPKISRKFTGEWIVACGAAGGKKTTLGILQLSFNYFALSFFNVLGIHVSREAKGKRGSEISAFSPVSILVCMGMLTPTHQSFDGLSEHHATWYTCAVAEELDSGLWAFQVGFRRSLYPCQPSVFWKLEKPCLQWLYFFFFVNFGDGNWRQAEAWNVLLAGAAEVNALALGALRQFTQWLWIEHPTFQSGGGHFTTELFPPPIVFSYPKCTSFLSDLVRVIEFKESLKYCLRLTNMSS